MVAQKLHVLEKSIIEDARLRFTFISYSLILVSYVNLNLLQSFAIGIVCFVVYFLINGMFLAHIFFENEPTFFRLAFGFLLLIMLLGFVGWIIMIIYNLDVSMFTLTLVVTTTISSILNSRVKHKHVTD